VRKTIFLFPVLILAIILLVILFEYSKKNSVSKITQTVQKSVPSSTLSNLQIEAMKSRSYPGSDFITEQTLASGSNYKKYVASYQSDGLKIYGLLTVPNAKKPANGFPAILFNHGYITPATYQTNPSVGQYASYVDAIARRGYVVFKPDYRGNGNSQGSPEGAYYSPAYTVDDLNALASLKKYSEVNPDKIGAWGHSMGGNITLRGLVVDPSDIKVAVIWGGVVGSYTQLEHWHDPSYHPSAYELSLRFRYRSTLEKQFGTPETDPTFWNSIDPTNFVSDIKAPLQLHVGTADEEVPNSFSQSLYDKMKSEGKDVSLFEYPGDNHNISNNFSTAMGRSVDFFNKYLK